MRVPLTAYPARGCRVHSLVARLPFTPVDLDIGRLARGEWDAYRDRFRVWFIPKIDGRDNRPLCNFTIRKFDPDSGVLLFMHLTMDLDAVFHYGSSHDYFTIGILCNDDVRARAALGAFFDNPPAYHRRGEARLIERRWRHDPAVVMYFLANVHSVLSADPQAPRAVLKVEDGPSLDVLAMLKDSMGGWWESKE